MEDDIDIVMMDAITIKIICMVILIVNITIAIIIIILLSIIILATIITSIYAILYYLCPLILLHAYLLAPTGALGMSLSICLSVHPSVRLSVHLSVCPSVSLSVCLPVWPSVHPCNTSLSRVLFQHLSSSLKHTRAN